MKRSLRMAIRMVGHRYSLPALLQGAGFLTLYLRPWLENLLQALGGHSDYLARRPALLLSLAGLAVLVLAVLSKP